MNIPKSIMIGEHKIDISLVGSDIISCSGQYNNWYKTIKINIDDSPESLQAVSFFHEIIEAINETMELNLEHRSISVLVECLLSAIRRNNLDFRSPKQ